MAIIQKYIILSQSNVSVDNCWHDDSTQESNVHVRVYLEDTARKWSRVQENQWKGAAVPMIWSDFTKEFLEAFQHNHIPSMLLARLQARKQQPSESAIDYYYDVLDLCRQIDEMSEVKMTETTRVHYQVY